MLPKMFGRTPREPRVPAGYPQPTTATTADAETAAPEPTATTISSRRQTLRTEDPTFLWKLVLRTLSIIVAAIAIGLIAWAELHQPLPSLSPSSNNDYSSTTYTPPPDTYINYYGDDVYLPWEHISLGLSIIWNIANVAVLFVRRGRGIHPGANVGCDLILWLAFIVTGFFATVGAADYIIGYNQNVYYNYYNSNGVDNNDCAPFLNCSAQGDYSAALVHKGVVIAVGCAFTFLLVLFHFALFVSACRYTHARKFANGRKYAKAITAEATEIARKIITDMGYPPPGQMQQQQMVQAQEGGQMHTGQQQQQQQPITLGHYNESQTPVRQSYLPYSPTSNYSTPQTQRNSVMTPQEREMQERYEAQVTEAEPQGLGPRSPKGKGRDVEQGGFPLGNNAASSAKPAPHITVESPSSH